MVGLECALEGSPQRQGPAGPQMPAGRMSLPAQLREQGLPSQTLPCSPPPSLLLRFRRGAKGTEASVAGEMWGEGERENQLHPQPGPEQWAGAHDLP